MPDARLVAAASVALTVTLVAIFSLRPLAPRVGLVDRPDARKCHKGRIPLIGGLCFFTGLVAGLSYLGTTDRFVVVLLGSSALIMLTTVGAGLVYIYYSRPVKTNEIYTNFPAYLTGLIITTVLFSYVIAGKSMLRSYGWFITSLPVLGMIAAFCLPYIIFFR